MFFTTITIAVLQLYIIYRINKVESLLQDKTRNGTVSGVVNSER